jgi:hypothetical protein
LFLYFIRNVGVDFTKYKLGKKPFKEDPKDLKLKSYIDKDVLPTPPASTTDYLTFKDWKMLLNDEIGDCAIAGPYHLLMLWCKQAGKKFDFTDEDVLDSYRKISGYDPEDPSTDVGCNLRDVLIHWKNVGFPDKQGKLHKIGAFALLDLKDHQMVKIAQYLFSGLVTGLIVPKYVLERFEQGEYSFDVETINAEPQGGHCMVMSGYGKYQFVEIIAVTKEGVWAITWGKIVFITWEFWDKNFDEAWVIFDEEFLKNGKSPDGFDKELLLKHLKKLSEA